MATLMKSSFDSQRNEICLDFMSSDEDGIGSLYEIRKKIKYIVTVPGVERRIYCPNAKTVATALKRHGIEFTMWQLYRYLKRPSDAEAVEPKLMGATVTKV